MDFVERHRRRLDQHIECGMAKGVANFLHILRSVGNLLLSQIDRIVVALRAETRIEMRPDHWYEIRNHLDDYYQMLERLLKITAVDYVDAMLDAGQKIGSEFAESLPDLMKLYGRARENRDLINTLQQSRLTIIPSTGVSIRDPGFF